MKLFCVRSLYVIISLTLVGQTYGIFLPLNLNMGKLKTKPNLNVENKGSDAEVDNGNQANINLKVNENPIKTTTSTIFQNLKDKMKDNRKTTQKIYTEVLLRKVNLKPTKKSLTQILKNKMETLKKTNILEPTKAKMTKAPMAFITNTKTNDKYQTALHKIHIPLSYIEKHLKIQKLKRERAKIIDKYMSLYNNIGTLQTQWYLATEPEKLQIQYEFDKFQTQLNDLHLQLTKIDYKLEGLYRNNLEKAHKLLDDIEDLLCDKNIELKLKQNHKSDATKSVDLLNDNKHQLAEIILELEHQYATFKNSQLNTLNEEMISLERNLKWLIMEMKSAKDDRKAKLNKALNDYQAVLLKIQPKLEKTLVQASEANRTVINMEINALREQAKELKTKLAKASDLDKPLIEREIKTIQILLDSKINELNKYMEIEPKSLEDQNNELINKMIFSIINYNNATDEKKNKRNMDFEKALETLKLLNQGQNEMEAIIANKRQEKINDLKQQIKEMTINLQKATKAEKPLLEKALQKAQTELKNQQIPNDKKLNKNVLNKAKIELESLEETFHQLNNDFKVKPGKLDNETIIYLLKTINKLADIMPQDDKPQPLKDAQTALHNKIVILIDEWKNNSNNKNKQFENFVKQTEADLSLNNAELDKMRVEAEEIKFSKALKVVEDLKLQKSKLENQLSTDSNNHKEKEKLSINLRRINKRLNNEKDKLESQRNKLLEETKTAATNTKAKLENMNDMLNASKEELENGDDNLDATTKKDLEETKNVYLNVTKNLQDILWELNDKLEKMPLDVMGQDKNVTENKLAQLQLEKSNDLLATIQKHENQLDNVKKSIENSTAKMDELEKQIKQAPDDQKPQLKDELKRTNMQLNEQQYELTKLQDDWQKEIKNALKDIKYDLDKQKIILNETTNKMLEMEDILNPKTKHELEETKSLLTATIPHMEDLIEQLEAKEKPDNLLQQKQALLVLIEELGDQLPNANDNEKLTLENKLQIAEIDLAYVLGKLNISQINRKENERDDIEDEIDDISYKINNMEDDLETATSAEKPAIEDNLEDLKADLVAKEKVLAEINNDLKNLTEAAAQFTKTKLQEFKLKAKDSNNNPTIQMALENAITGLNDTESILKEKLEKLQPQNIMLIQQKELEDEIKQLKLELTNANATAKDKILKNLNDDQHKLNMLPTKFLIANINLDKDKRNKDWEVVNQLRIQINGLQDKLDKAENGEKSEIEKTLEKVQTELREKEINLADVDRQLKENIQNLLNITKTQLNDFTNETNEDKALKPKDKHKNSLYLWQIIQEFEGLPAQLQDEMNTTKPQNVEDLKQNKSILELHMQILQALLNEANGLEKIKLEEQQKQVQNKLRQLNILLKIAEIETQVDKRQNIENALKDNQQKLIKLENNMKTAMPNEKPLMRKELEQAKSELKKNEDNLVNLQNEINKGVKSTLDDAGQRLNEFNSQLQIIKMMMDDNDLEPQKEKELQMLQNNLKQQIQEILIMISKLSNQDISMENQRQLQELIVNFNRLLENIEEEKTKDTYVEENDENSIGGENTITINSNGQMLNEEALEELKSKMHDNNVRVIVKNTPIDKETYPEDMQASISIKADENTYNTIMSVIPEFIYKLTNGPQSLNTETAENVSDSEITYNSTVTIKSEGNVEDEEMQLFLQNMLNRMPDGTKITYSQTNVNSTRNGTATDEDLSQDPH